MNQIILDTPKDVVNEIVKAEDAGIYNIKIKCLGCSETKFISYEPIFVNDLIVAIGEHCFPIAMIEKVTIRCRDEWIKLEYQYKVSAKYLKTLLNENAQRLLAEFKL